jgi:probable addiction module antidote protein
MSKAKARRRPKALKLAPFDASEHLDSEEVIAEYLAAALEDPNPDVFLLAVANVAKARGVAAVAKASGLGRESLYKALAPGAKVRYETVRKLLDSLGVRLTVV